MIKYDENYYYNLLRIHTKTAPDIIARRYQFIQKHIIDKENPPAITISKKKAMNIKRFKKSLENRNTACADAQVNFCAKPKTRLLDYGCGVGFMKSLAPGDFDVDTFDIMPVPMTGIKHDQYDIITMYDVLEHIPDFQEVFPVLATGRYVVISIPMKPINVPWKKYKHFKPGEHLHYFTDDLIQHLFDFMGFDFVALGAPECPPREYIMSYIFKNRRFKK